MSKKKSFLINTGLFFASVLVSLMIAELVIRWVAPQQIQPRFMIDSGFGNRVPAPNKTYRHSVPGDYAITINTNDFGGRGERNYAVQKPERVARVCLLGDSFVFGYGVEDDQVVSHVLENRLSEFANDARKYEVLNFGVSGYGQAEQLNLYVNRVQPYGCDDVIAFYYSNDPGNNVVSSLYKINDTGEVVRDKQAYLPGVKIQENLYGAPIVGGMIAHSHLWSLIRNQASAVIHRRMLAKQGLSNYSTADTNTIDLTVALFKELEQRTARDGSRFFVFVIPDFKMQSNYPFELMAALENRTINGIEFLAADDYLKIDRHWNSQGHVKAGDAITKKYQSDWGRPGN